MFFMHKKLYHNPIISRTILSETFIVPTRTNILNTNSPIYFQTCDTAAKFGLTVGGDEANKLNMIHDNIIIAPSKHTAV